jgi:phage gpG-like protein
MRIVFEVAGDVQVNRDILRVGAYARDARPAFAAIADLIMDETALQFATQGAHASGGWAPLKPATIAEKERAGFGSRGILERTLRLEESLTVKGDPDMILDIRPDELAFGSRVPYAGAHQNPKPGSHLPQRRPVELTEEARRTFIKILQRWIITGEVI